MAPWVCVRCGTAAPPGLGERVLAGWMTQTDRGGTVHVCGECARHNLRDIEAKLDDEYWSG